MANKLSLTTAVNRLREADEMRAVAVAKLKKPDSEPGAVRVKSPSENPKLTRITQVSGPSLTKPKEDTKAGLKIPQAEDGGEAVRRAPRMTFKNVKHGTQGGIKAPPTKTVKKPSDASRVIHDPIKRTEEGGGFGQNSDFISGSASANQIEAGMPKGLKSGSNNTPTVGKVKAAEIGPESPNAGKVAIKQPVMNRTIPQIKKPSGFIADPSDAGSRSVKIAKESVRSGVVVQLGEKVKARFGLASVAMLDRMVESYRQHGYDLKVVATGEAGWKRDRELITKIWESVDAEFNFVSDSQKRLRKEALNRLSQISQTDYNSLYESRQEFVDTLVEGFGQIERAVRRRYTESLELMLCNVRFTAKGTPIDAEITTEAHSPEMALRQIRNLLQENYGLDTQITHIFVDGKKFLPEQIVPWERQS